MNLRDEQIQKRLEQILEKLPVSERYNTASDISFLAVTLQAAIKHIIDLEQDISESIYMHQTYPESENE